MNWSLWPPLTPDLPRMPPQKHAEKGTTERRILDAAVQLFSHQGFNGTSTREIARLADVNEATLFRYFARKQDLFWAAVQLRLEKVRVGRQLQAALAKRSSPEIVIPLIVEFLVQIAAFHPELTRLLHFSFLELRSGAEAACKRQFGPIFDSMVAYIASCAERGLVESSDPVMTVIAIGTMIISHRDIAEFFTGRTASFAGTDEAIATYSRFWVSALVPTSRLATQSTTASVASAND